VLRRPQNGGISAASNGALSLASGEFVGLLDHDDELTPDALFEVVKLLNETPDLDFIYTDEDKLSPEGRREEPFFKPDWSPDLLLSLNYITHLAVIRRHLLEEVGGFTEGLEGSQDYDLFLRISEKTQKIGHIAKPLYSWRKIPQSTAYDSHVKPYAHSAGQQALQAHLHRRGIAGEVVDGLITPYRYRVRYPINGQPLVSIIIPTKDRVELLKGCIDSIEGKTTYRNFEIIILDNQSEKPDTLAYLASSSHRVVSVPNPFNYSRINNIGVTHARGEFLLFLNNDTVVITEEWLTAMLEHAQREKVGAVGAKLLYPNQTIQHAGAVLGFRGVAGHVFWHMQDKERGYCDFPHVIRNYSAVTAACLMMKKSIFTEVGGFNEGIQVAFNDIDLCLRIREKGYLIVYTPYATLYHLESASRKKLHPADDEEYFRKRWASVIHAGDPYYNPHLSLERFDFSLRILDSHSSS
jgi:GT2 family glycosyltransferase